MSGGATGLFGLWSSFVSLAEASEVGDQIQVSHERTLVEDAPNIEADGYLSVAEEAELYRHYRLDYDSERALASRAPEREPPSAAARDPGRVELAEGQALRRVVAG